MFSQTAAERVFIPPSFPLPSQEGASCPAVTRPHCWKLLGNTVGSLLLFWPSTQKPRSTSYTEPLGREVCKVTMSVLAICVPLELDGTTRCCPLGTASARSTWDCVAPQHQPCSSPGSRQPGFPAAQAAFPHVTPQLCPVPPGGRKVTGLFMTCYLFFYFACCIFFCKT